MTHFARDLFSSIYFLLNKQIFTIAKIPVGMVIAKIINVFTFRFINAGKIFKAESFFKQQPFCDDSFAGNAQFLQNISVFS